MWTIDRYLNVHFIYSVSMDFIFSVFLRQHVAFITFLSVVGRDISDYWKKACWNHFGVWIVVNGIDLLSYESDRHVIVKFAPVASVIFDNFQKSYFKAF